MSKKIKSSLPQKSILATALLIALGSQVSQAATITVLNNNATGPDSLAAAIATSNANGESDTILFDSSLSGSTIEVTDWSGAISINDAGEGTTSLTIQGLGRDSLTLTNQNNAAQIFTISGKDVVTISDLTIDVNRNDEGTGAYGGVIITASSTNSLILNNVTLNNSQGNPSLNEEARGIRATNVASLSVSNSTISNMNDQSAYGGGAISIENSNASIDFSVSNSLITGNSTMQDGGAINAKSSNGHELDMSISNTTFNNNIAGGKGSDKDGGAINITTSDSSANSKFVIASSTFSNNTASGDGGALHVRLDGGENTNDVVIVNSTFSGNTATDDGGAIAISTGYATANTIIANSTITENVSNSEGSPAGLQTKYHEPKGFTNLSIVNSVISGNNSDGDGANNVRTNNFTTLGTVKGNYFGTSANFTVPANNLSGDAPDLGALGDNGGVTQTHVPNDGSPLIDAGDSSLLTVDGTTLAVDQRNMERVFGDSVDIGAVEVGGSLVIGGGTTTTTTTTTATSSGSSSSAFGFAWLTGASFLLALLRRRRK